MQRICHHLNEFFSITVTFYMAKLPHQIVLVNPNLLVNLLSSSIDAHSLFKVMGYAFSTLHFS